MLDEFLKVVDAIHGMGAPGIQTSVVDRRQDGQIIRWGVCVTHFVQAAINKLLELGQHRGRVHANRIDEQVAAASQFAVFEEFHKDVLDATQFDGTESEKGGRQRVRITGQRFVLGDETVEGE